MLSTRQDRLREAICASQHGCGFLGLIQGWPLDVDISVGGQLRNRAAQGGSRAHIGLAFQGWGLGGVAAALLPGLLSDCLCIQLGRLSCMAVGMQACLSLPSCSTVQHPAGSPRCCFAACCAYMLGLRGWRLQHSPTSQPDSHTPHASHKACPSARHVIRPLGAEGTSACIKGSWGPAVPASMSSSLLRGLS